MRANAKGASEESFAVFDTPTSLKSKLCAFRKRCVPSENAIFSKRRHIRKDIEQAKVTLKATIIPRTALGTQTEK